MKRNIITQGGLALSALAAVSVCGCAKHEQKPNIVFIFADDLGYGEVGSFGQGMIETPNMDRLAAEGMIFTDAYAGSPVSAPSRCVLLTGLHSGHAHIRGNDEWAERGEVWNYAKVSEDINLEGQRPIPAASVTIPKLLKTAGYATGCFGKWGLGSPVSEGAPHKQGFDLFYGFNCQRQAHSYFPNHLWRNGERVTLDNEIIAPGTKLAEGEDPYDGKSYERFFQKDYSAELVLNESLDFMEKNIDRPFFVYYATTLPHKPIQAPKRLVEKYVEKFGDEEPYTGGSYYPCRYPRATYAAMITYLDEQIGDIVAKLKELGVYDNTLIIVTSDNGPAYQSQHFGSAAPFQSAGSRIKGSLYEGGIREPFIASWKGRIAPGTVSDLPVAMYDVMPTLCEAAGITGGYKTDGISFLPEMLGNGKQKRHEYLYWEYPQGGGQQAVRMGNLKGLRTGINKEGNMHVALYDLANDIQETTDVSAKHPEVVAIMEQIMAEERTTPALPVFYLKPLDNQTTVK